MTTKSKTKTTKSTKLKPQSTIIATTPKLMSEAFMIASKHPLIEQDHGTYIESMGDNPEGMPKLAVCAIGALFAMCATERQILKEIDDGGDRSSMVKVICKGIKGACDPVPFEVWKKYDNSEDNKQAYDVVAKDGRRWVDLAEYLFEDEDKSFVQIAREFKKYGR